MIVPTRTIAHPCIDITVVKDIADIPKIVCNKKQAQKEMQRFPIFITDADND